MVDRLRKLFGKESKFPKDKMTCVACSCENWLCSTAPCERMTDLDAPIVELRPTSRGRYVFAKSNLELSLIFHPFCSVLTSQTLQIMLFVLLAEVLATFRGIAELKCNMTILVTQLEWTTVTKLTKRCMNYTLHNFFCSYRVQIKTMNFAEGFNKLL